jgi:hypothetical protein
LQFCGDTTLLGKLAGIEPGAAQFLDARAVGPAVISGLAVGPQSRIAERVDVRDRAIDQREDLYPGSDCGSAWNSELPTTSFCSVVFCISTARLVQDLTWRKRDFRPACSAILDSPLSRPIPAELYHSAHSRA